MKLSRTVSYALRATMFLAKSEPNKPIPCSQIAQAGDMPERFLLQILRTLVNHGLLRSTRGVDGGYKLARPASELSVLNIIEAVEGPMTEAASDPSASPDVKRINGALREVSTTLCRQLDAIKISQLVSAPKKTGKASLN